MFRLIIHSVEKAIQKQLQINLFPVHQNIYLTFYYTLVIVDGENRQLSVSYYGTDYSAGFLNLRYLCKGNLVL